MSPDNRGCLYAGELFSPGATKQSGKAVSDGGNIAVIDDPDGIPMRCIEDRDVARGYRWDVQALGSR